MKKKNKNVLLFAAALIILGLVYLLKNSSGYEISEPEETETVKISEDRNISPDESSEKERTIIVYVSGEVVRPGIYELPEGARIYEAVSLAGGMKESADFDALNQAERLTDGEHIVVYKEGEEPASAGSFTGQSGLVNINTADINELTLLPGIGESKASNIIEYRKNNGNFQCIEDIMNVSGIGEALFSQIRSKIKV